MALLLTRRDVEGLLDMDGAIEATLHAFKSQAAGAVSALPPRMLTAPRGALRIVSGALLDSQRMGIRVGPAAGYNDPASEDTRMVAVLYDTESGDLLSVMSYSFGTLRTGATVGLATRFFAREDSRVLAQIGAGRNALSLIRAVCHVRPIEEIRVFRRDAGRLAAFVERASAALGRPVRAVGSTEEASLGADVVCVATDSREPVIRQDQLSPGVFLATMGRPSEIDPSIYLAADQVVVGHKQHEQEYWDQRYAHQIVELVKAGKLSWDSGIVEIADVAADKAPQRTSPGQTIVFKESQGGFGDIAFAAHVYAEARRRGLGQEVAM
jgi:ornithine cyclodeaminase